MISQQPEIAGKSGRLVRNFRDRVFIRQSRRGVLRLEQPLKFNVIETDEVEIVVRIAERLEFLAQKRLVPARVQRKQVVCNNQRASLRFGEVAQDYHRSLLHAEFARRQYPRVPGEDFILGIHQNRVSPTELPDRCSGLSNLLPAVRARIVGARD
jgi:hypothetical protein